MTIDIFDFFYYNFKMMDYIEEEDDGTNEKIWIE